MIVSKFGGTSVKDAANMRQCAEIVLSNNERRLIVLSATAGTTNTLTDLGEYLQGGNTSRDVINETLAGIEERHLDIYQELMPEGDVFSVRFLLKQLRIFIDEFLMKTPNEQKIATHELVSFGERLSSAIFSDYLNSLNQNTVLFDARNVIRTENFTPRKDMIEQLAQEHLHPLLLERVVITQGFIGRDLSGQTSTLGRGGSDYSAALFAWALESDLLEIFTDVSGVKSCDPNLVEGPITLHELSYKEAAELSNFGAKVIHPLALAPCQDKNIPMQILSTFDPEAKGTLITANPCDERPVKALAKRDNQTLIVLSSPSMIGIPGFLARVFNTLAKYDLSVDLVTTSEASVAITIDSNNNGYGGKFNLAPELSKELSEFCNIKIEENLSLVAMIGNRPDGYFNFQTSSHMNINARLFCQGASIHNVCFLVPTKEANQTIFNLHEQVFNNENVGASTL